MKKNLNLLYYFLKKDTQARYAGSGLGILRKDFQMFYKLNSCTLIFSAQKFFDPI
jgi:ABC-type polysaccharide/polyol phosphate export permease